MSISGEMFIVVSLMLAVFAAIAAIGTSVVLGVGYERLRAGFEIVKKQTGFFADAIHQLDQRADDLDKQSRNIKEAVSSLDTRVDRVEKQSNFFFESLNTLESQILSGEPAKTKPAKQNKQEAPKEEKPKMVMPQVMEWSSTEHTRELLEARQDQVANEPVETRTTSRLTSTLYNYLLSDNSADNSNRVVYH